MSDFYLSEGEATLWLVLLLVFFFLMAGCAVPLTLRELRRRKVSLTDDETADFWYTARNSQNWLSIALSVCATSAGAWMVYTPSEAAVMGGWWALLGYCVAIFLAPLAIIIFGPQFREMLKDGANITDWVGQRFGLASQLWVTVCLVYYMFIYLATQLKTMGDTIFGLSGMDPEKGIIPVAGVTLLYTAMGGLPASILTDQIQAVAIWILVCAVCFPLWGWVDVDQESWEKASVWTDRGFEMSVSLCFGVFGAEVFNLAFWQRVYAARDDRQLRLGFLVGGLSLSLLTFIFGFSGMLLNAQNIKQNGGVSTIVVPAFTFFEIYEMEQCTKSFKLMIYILIMCMIASCADSFQTGMNSVISRTLMQRKLGSLPSLLIGELFLLILNVPCVIFAAVAVRDTNENFDGLAVKITDLFSMADIVTITLVVPIFSGLWSFSTNLGCLAGMGSGMATVVIWGWFEFGNLMGGLEMITMMCFGNHEPEASEDGAPGCGLYARRGAMIFPLIVLVTSVVTMVVSFMDRSWQVLALIAKHYSLAPSTPEALKESNAQTYGQSSSAY